MGVLSDNLPGRLASDTLMHRLLGMFEELNGSVTVHADALEHVVDLSVTSPEMVRYLALWIGVDDIDPSLPALRQRELVEHRGQLLPWRGTRRGLEGLLRLITDAEVEIVDSGGVYAENEAPATPPRVRIQVQSTGEGTEEQFVALVQREIPAEVALELYIGDRLAWPREDVAVTPRSATSHQPQMMDPEVGA
jgi:phage tail-like protein